MNERDAATILHGQTDRLASVVPSKAVNVAAKINLVMVLLLILAGSLVTGHKAALSDPTWPKFVGQWYPTAETFVGGLRYEDTHRVIAGTTGMVTLILALLASLREKRRQVVVLAWIAVGAVFVQALLGGGIILSNQHPMFSVVHAIVAQTYLLVITSLVVLTSVRWLKESSQIERPANDGIRREFKWATGLIFLQLIVGAGVRHANVAFLAHLIAHMLLGGGVLIIAVWLFLRVRKEYPDYLSLRKGLMVVQGLLGLQFLLGVASIFANRARVDDAAPHLNHIVVSSSHVVNGAIILALMTAMTMFVHRRLRVTHLNNAVLHCQETA